MTTSSPHAVHHARIYALDVLKVLSCLAVILMHTMRRFDINVTHYPFIYYLTRFAVPVFFMVAGALQLTKDSVTVRYCLLKALRILAVIVGYVLLDFIFCCCKGRDITSISYDSLYALYRRDFDIFWFFETLMEAYIVLPLLLLMFKRWSTWLVVALGVFTVSLDAYDFVNIKFLDAADTIQKTHYWGRWLWLFYFVLGGYVFSRKIWQKFSKRCWACLTAAATLLADIYMYDMLYRSTQIVNGGFAYRSIFMVLWCVCLMCFFMKFGFERWAGIISFMGALLVPMFALHMFSIRLVSGISVFHHHVLMQYPAYIAIVCLTTLMSWVLSKLPVLKCLTRI